MLTLCTSCLYKPLGPAPAPSCSEFEADFSAFLFPGCCSACRGRVLEVNWFHLHLCRNKEAYLQGSWGKPSQEPWLLFQEFLVMSSCPWIRARGISPVSVPSALRAGDCCSGRGRRSPASKGMAAVLSTQPHTVCPRCEVACLSPINELKTLAIKKEAISVMLEASSNWSHREFLGREFLFP